MHTGGLQCLDLIMHANNTQPNIVIYSSSVNDNACKQAMEKGSTTFVEKQKNVENLASVLKSVIN